MGGAMNTTCKAAVGTPEEMNSTTIVLDEVCPCVEEAMMTLGTEGIDCAPTGRESFSRLCINNGSLPRRPDVFNPFVQPGSIDPHFWRLQHQSPLQEQPTVANISADKLRHVSSKTPRQS